MMSEWKADLPLPEPDQVRKAIDETDERARLLRRLLRIVLRLSVCSPVAASVPVPPTDAK